MRKILVFMAIMMTSAYAFSPPLFFAGTITAQEKFNAKYDMVSEKVMRVTPKSASNHCDFKIKRNNLPHLQKGRPGIIFSNKIDKCKFLIENKEAKKFWNSIVMLDFSFYIKEGGIFGKAKLYSKLSSFDALLKNHP